MCPAQGPQHSDAGEARTRGPRVSIQAQVRKAAKIRNRYNQVPHIPHGEVTKSVLFYLTSANSTELDQIPQNAASDH